MRNRGIKRRFFDKKRKWAGIKSLLKREETSDHSLVSIDLSAVAPLYIYHPMLECKPWSISNAKLSKLVNDGSKPTRKADPPSHL